MIRTPPVLRAAKWIAATVLVAGCAGTHAYVPQASSAGNSVSPDRCAWKFYAPTGSPNPLPIRLHGPGVVLGGGGTDVDAEFVWIHDTVVGSHRRRGGDLVVLRATGNDDYDRYIYRLAPYRSVRTLRVPRCSPADVLRRAAAIVARSSAVFFAGGDQADYVIWKNTPIQGAVQQVYDAGGVIGGTSAGEAILGDFVFNALNDNRRDATSYNAVRHPYERLIGFTYDFLHFPPLKDAITDMHFVTRKRFGRTAVFMARQIAGGRVRRNPPVVLGIGVDEASGIAIDKDGIGTLLLQGRGGSAFLIRGGPAKSIDRTTPFVSAKLTVTKLERQGDRFNFGTWCGSEPTYDVSVNGNDPAGDIYMPSDPYVPPSDARIPKC